MDNFFNDLKSTWQQEKSAAKPAIDIDALLQKAAAYKQHTLRFQWGNAGILSLTLVMYIVFFHRFLLYGTLLSKLGFLLMAVPLGIRIAAELVSILRGRAIAWDNTAKDHTALWTRFTAFRKWMHGTLTYCVMALYTLGYYCIMVQMAELVPAWLTGLMCVAYPVGAWIIILQVRKGIRREIRQLEWLAGLEQQLEG